MLTSNPCGCFSFFVVLWVARLIPDTVDSIKESLSHLNTTYMSRIFTYVFGILTIMQVVGILFKVKGMFTSAFNILFYSDGLITKHIHTPNDHNKNTN